MYKITMLELKKLLHKKSLYVIYIIIFGFCLLNNVLFKTDYDSNGYYKYDFADNSGKEISKLNKELSKYNRENKNEVLKYVDVKTKIDILKVKNKYDIMSWQYNKAYDYLRDIVYDINYNKYINKNNDRVKELDKEFNNLINRFDNNDWKYFINRDKLKLDEELINYKKILDNTNDTYQRELIQDKYDDIKNGIDIINCRLNNNINYSTSYLNDAVREYYNKLDLYKKYDDKNIKKLGYEDKIKYYDLKKDINIDKYIIDNKENVKKINSLNCLIRDIVDDYEIFIVIAIILVSSIVLSEEFSKGTIKLLLIKPYKRSKILLGKYLSCVIILLITIIYIVLIQLVIGGYIFGFDTLWDKVVVYNNLTDSIVKYNVFKYLLIKIIYNMPLFIMILTIAFFISVISVNTVSSLCISIIIYMFSSVINNLVLHSRLLSILFITNNWNMKYYLFGGIGINRYINIKISLFVWFIYYVVLMLSSFIIFKRKNIKNI